MHHRAVLRKGNPSAEPVVGHEHDRVAVRPPVIDEALRSSGQPLTSADARDFAVHFGHDFGRVRVHADGLAARSADAVSALAYTVGQDVVFARGQYEPGTAGGRQLLAHELGHVVEQSRAGVQILQRQPVRARPGSFPGLAPSGTNYRFDTHRVTADDLSSPDIIARFEALTVEGLHAYEGRVADTAVKSYIIGLIGMRERAQRITERPKYLEMVQEAVKGMEGKEIADRTLSGLLMPLLTELSRPSRVTWRDDVGAETGGASFKLTPPGKGAKKKVELRLVLDEADPRLQPVAGYFSESKGQIVLIVRRNPTVKEIRETLFHEGLHLAISIMRSQGKAALGEKDPAVEALEKGLNKATAIADLKNRLELLRVEVDASRKQRSLAALAPGLVDSVAPELWEEVVVAAETSYFSLIRAIGTDEQPSPDYMTTESVKAYLEHYGFMTKRDMGALTENETKRIEILKDFINIQIRALIKSRGLINYYIPDSREPGKPVLVTPSP